LLTIKWYIGNRNPFYFNAGGLNMDKRIKILAVIILAIFLIIWINKSPTKQEATKMFNEHSLQRPPIDERVPAKLETATFAMG
jgi:hypothetical protein